ncbi:hypothetical protein GS399_04575 [Pedobacter sp. HMF7647]|uniref:Uncharacterized protein n=1 Tax=Hufsiella arboris TaxID=2695275 RepID=A0A7K1Y6N2_9SPHI|nr:hypothetical protein [Hufsiella arboris]MXV50236.1 hypothetical protein [Hufsiella arboris]
MKRLLFFCSVFLIAACKKEYFSNDKSDPAGIEISSVTFPSFIKSSWRNVLGGKGLIEFEYKIENDSTINNIQDSLEIKDINAYKRNLKSGKYDITLKPKCYGLADTFLRFEATLKGLSVTKKEAISLTVTTNDGLITIDKDYVKDGTIPTFKEEGGSKNFRLGLSSGFYFLYVKGGTKGALSFRSTAIDQGYKKAVSVKKNNHYNLIVNKKDATSIEVCFGPFEYHDQAKKLLVTIDGGPYVLTNFKKAIFVAADENGSILSSAEFTTKSQIVKLYSNGDFSKDRLNIFKIAFSKESLKPIVTGFIQIKKGSILEMGKSYFLKMAPSGGQFKVSMAKQSVFEKLIISTNKNSQNFDFIPDSTSLKIQNYSYSSDSKLYLQVKKNNITQYDFFDIQKGSKNIIINPDKCSKTPVQKTIMMGGTECGVSIYARPNKLYNDGYRVYEGNTMGDRIDIFIPKEKFETYAVFMSCIKNSLTYINTYNKPEIPSSFIPINASAKIGGSYLSDIDISIKGTYSYYSAFFNNQSFSLNILSPSTAKYFKYKLPDFSNFFDAFTYNSTDLKFSGLYIYEKENFNERKLNDLSSDFDMSYNQKIIIY